MSLKFKFISTVSLAGAIAVFSGASLAQDTTATAPVTGDKVEKHHRGDHGGRGKGEFGHKGEFGARGGHRGGMFGSMKGIQLTDAQKEQLKALRQANRPDKATFEEMHKLMIAVHDGSSTPEQQARLKELSQQMMAKRQAQREQFLAVLTPDQKAQMEANKAEQKQRREEFKQKREEWRKNRKDAAPATTTTKPAIS